MNIYILFFLDIFFLMYKYVSVYKPYMNEYLQRKEEKQMIQLEIHLLAVVSFLESLPNKCLIL